MDSVSDSSSCRCMYPVFFLKTEYARPSSTVRRKSQWPTMNTTPKKGVSAMMRFTNVENAVSVHLSGANKQNKTKHTKKDRQFKPRNLKKMKVLTARGVHVAGKDLIRDVSAGCWVIRGCNVALQKIHEMGARFFFDGK